MPDTELLQAIADANVGRIEWGDGVVSNSQLQAFEQCELKWWARYVARLSPPEKSLRLDIGSAWHEILRYYRQALILTDHDPGEAHEAARFAMSNIRELVPGIDRDELAAERLPWMLEGYLEAYPDDHERFEYLAVEYELLVPLGDSGVDFGAYIDYVKRDRRSGRVIAGDTKTAGGKDLSKEAWGMEVTFSAQFMRYAAGLTAEGTYKPRRFEWDSARTDKLKRDMLLSERYARVGPHVSAAAMDAAWDRTILTAKRLVALRETNPGENDVLTNPSFCAPWNCDFYRPHVESSVTGGSFLDMALSYGFKQKERHPRADTTEETA